MRGEINRRGDGIGVGVGVVRVERDRALPGGEIHLGLTINDERRDATGETTRCDGCDDAMTDDGFLMSFVPTHA